MDSDSGSGNDDSNAYNKQLYNIVSDILYGNPPDQIPEELVPLIGSHGFHQVKEWFDVRRQDEIRLHSPILRDLDINPVTAALMFLLDIDPIAKEAIKGAPDYDVIKHIITSDDPVRESRHRRCEEIYSNATTDLPLDVMKQIVLQTKGLKQLEKLYLSSPVFACILDDVDVLRVLKDRAIDSGRVLPSTPTNNTDNVGDVRLDSFDAYLWFIKQYFYNYNTEVTNENVNTLLYSAIQDDDLEWYLHIESVIPFNGSVGIAIDITNTEEILKYMLDTKPITTVCLCVMILMARPNDVREIYDALSTIIGNDGGVLSAGMLASLCHLDVPHEETKDVVLGIVRQRDDITTELLTQVSSYVSKINTRWLASDMLYVVTSVASKVGQGVNIIVYVNHGLLRPLARNINPVSAALRVQMVNSIALKAIPDDVHIAELKYFINSLLEDLTDNNIHHGMTDRTKAVLNECIDEYYESSMKSIGLQIQRQ